MTFGVPAAARRAARAERRALAPRGCSHPLQPQPDPCYKRRDHHVRVSRPAPLEAPHDWRYSPQMSEIATQKPSRAPSSFGFVRYVRRIPRSLQPRAKPVPRGGVIGRAMNVLLPWDMHDYPGKGRGWREIFKGEVADRTVRNWASGSNPMPSWAALLLAETLSQQAAERRQLAKELRAYAAEREAAGKAPQGFCRVDPVTGLDGRPRSGRRKVRELGSPPEGAPNGKGAP
jgi:hypothetical protein